MIKCAESWTVVVDQDSPSKKTSKKHKMKKKNALNIYVADECELLRSYSSVRSEMQVKTSITVDLNHTDTTSVFKELAESRCQLILDNDNLCVVFCLRIHLNYWVTW